MNNIFKLYNIFPQMSSKYALLILQKYILDKIGWIRQENTVRQSPTVLKLYSKTTSIIKIMIAYGKGIGAVFGDPG